MADFALLSSFLHGSNRCESTREFTFTERRAVKLGGNSFDLAKQDNFYSPIKVPNMTLSGDMRKINEAYNNAFRMIMQLPRYCSASHMFAMCNVPRCQAVMRNLVYRFTIRVDRSANKLLLCAIGSSDI